MVALVLVTAVGPLAADAYLPALPDLQRSLGTSALGAQLTLTTFLVGMAVGQLVCGTLSDTHGRRGFLLGGTTVFLLASIGTVIATDLTTLLASRVIQGLAAGCGIAVGRAVIGDCYDGLDAARRFATLATITMLGPVVAPTVGGLLLIDGTWRTVFGALVVLGVLMVTGTLVGLPESLPPSKRRESGLRRFFAGQVDLMRDRVFAPHVAVQCLLLSAMFTYLGGASFVMHGAYGTTDTFFAVIFAVNSGWLAAASVLFRVSVGRTPARTMRLAGLVTMAAFAVLLLGCGVSETAHTRPPLALSWLALAGISFGAGLALPATMTMAMIAGQRARGTASGLLSGLPFICAALATPLTGALGHDSILPMAAVMAGLVLSAALIDAVTRRPSASSRDEPVDCDVAPNPA